MTSGLMIVGSYDSPPQKLHTDEKQEMLISFPFPELQSLDLHCMFLM